MTNAEIKNWISYWTAARMVSFEEIRTVSDLKAARKFCACLRSGVFTNVTDAQIWEVLGRPAA